MKREVADTNYDVSWNAEFTTMHALYERIRILSVNGAYKMAVYVDSKTEYNSVFEELLSNGYEVNHYNGGNNGIMEVAWG